MKKNRFVTIVGLSRASQIFVSSFGWSLKNTVNSRSPRLRGIKIHGILVPLLTAIFVFL